MSIVAKRGWIAASHQVDHDTITTTTTTIASRSMSSQTLFLTTYLEAEISVVVVGSEDTAFKYAETRSVLSVCDGIAGVFGLANNTAETWSSLPAVSAT